MPSFKAKVIYIASALDGGLNFNFCLQAIALHKKISNLIVVSGSDEQEQGLFKKLKNARIKTYTNLCIDKPSVKNMIKGMIFLKHLVNQEKVNIIHVQTIYALIISFFSSKIFLRKKRVKILVTIHSTLHGTPYERLVLPFAKFIWGLCADKIICVSTETADRIKSCLSTSRKVVVVHNGISLNLFDAVVNGSTSVLSSISGHCSRVVIIYSANLIHRKGHQYLIKALPELLKKHPSVHLILTSEGPLKKELISLSKKLGISDNIFFSGRLCYSDLYKLLDDSDIYVFPSLSELFPFAILEAMAAAKPIIATNVGGVPEAVLDKVNGHIVPSRDPVALSKSIHKLIEDPQKARKMGIKGREIVEQKFDIDIIAQKLTNVYYSCLDENCRE